MTQEKKQLVIKDLCARVPYKPHICIKDGKVGYDTVLNGAYIHDWITIPSCQNMTIKPYLRPMSSMTEEENKDYKKTFETYENIMGVKLTYTSYSSYDWLNAHHFDYRGLIDKGLAIEAPEGMYKENV